MSKELEALKRFKDNIRWLEENTSLKHYFENNELHFKEDLDIIETALKEYEEIKSILYDENHVYKRIKALMIIREKDVDMWEFKCYKTLTDYNQNVSPLRWLTPEEYNLLNEVLL